MKGRGRRCYLIVVVWEGAVLSVCGRCCQARRASGRQAGRARWRLAAGRCLSLPPRLAFITTFFLSLIFASALHGDVATATTTLSVCLEHPSTLSLRVVVSFSLSLSRRQLPHCFRVPRADVPRGRRYLPGEGLHQRQNSRATLRLAIPQVSRPAVPPPPGGRRSCPHAASRTLCTVISCAASFRA